MEVKWAPIPGIEDRYEVSSDGRVRSVKFGRILKSSPSSGQKVVSIVVDGRIKVYEIRHLMAYAFLGADITSTTKPKLIHKDEDVHNISLDNLELADCSDAEGEIWKDISGFESSYEVSNYGRVRRKYRVDEYIRKDTNTVCVRHVSEMILRPTATSEYLEVHLTCREKSKYCRIHRLVAEAFVPNVNGLPQVNHIDGNKLNNASGNLEWVTHIQNISHAVGSGLLSNPPKGVYRAPVKVRCDQTGQEFENIKVAAESLGLRYNYLIERVRLGKACHGYTFTKL